MSDTPETDAKASPVFGKHSCATVLADFARKLERERDEALALAEERKGYWDDSVKEYEELRASFQRMTRERDKYKNAILECLETAVVIYKLRDAIHAVTGETLEDTTQ